MLRVLLWIAVSMFVVWAAVAQSPKQIDEAALRVAGKTGEDWITYNINWAEQRYSALKGQRLQCEATCCGMVL